MMLARTFLCFLALLFSFQYSQAQNSQTFDFAPLARLDLSTIKTSWHAKVYNIEQVFPGSDSYRNYLHQLKTLRFGQNNKIYQEGANSKKISSSEPILLDGFQGNPFGGIPNDNDLAISNDGLIVSVSNSDMYVYDEQGVVLYNVGLEDFADSLGLIANSYDPKVVYDPLEDRFILVFLNGSSASATEIVVCFSASNDPTGAWNVYALPGNPFNNNAWSDFPMIAFTANDFYVTVNHINNDSASWQTGFMQSVIWQVEKLQGYAGLNINTKVYSDINFGNKPIRNLLPIKGGFDIIDEGMFFISNRNFDFANDTFFLVRLPEALSSNPSQVPSVEVVLANQNYGLPPDAKQTPTTFLQTNDARALSGIFVNETIHFVGNTVETSQDLAAIYHGKIRLNESVLSVDLEIIKDNVLEFGYPNISFSGQTKYDEQAIISFNHTSIDSFPGMSAVFYSLNEGYSNRLHLATGTSNVGLIAGNFERWGDYSGSQRKYNEPGLVWMNGFVGFRNNLALTNKDQHRTYITKLQSPDTIHTALSINEALLQQVYPNPSEEQFYLSFELKENSRLHFKLYAIDGKLMSELLEKDVKAGANVFMFQTAQLQTGMYFVQVEDEQNHILLQEKIIKR